MLIRRKLLLSELCVVVLATIFGFEIVQEDNNLIKCLQAFIRNEVEELDSSLNSTHGIFWHKNETTVNKFIFGDLIDALLENSMLSAVLQVLPKNSKIHTNILFVTSSNSFKHLVGRIRQNLLYYTTGYYERYYVLLPNFALAKKSIIREIFRICFEKLIININVLVQDPQGTVNIYTYYPFTQTNCRSNKPVIYNRFKNGHLEAKKPSFTRKTGNLWKCPIKAVVWDDDPYIIIRQNQIDGLEIKFLNILANAMNFTLELLVAPGSGDVFENGTAEGAYQKVIEGQADLLFGGQFCLNHRQKVMENTVEYMTTTLDIVLRPPRSYNILEILLIPFESSVWLTILTACLAKWVCKLVFRKQLKWKRFISEAGTASRILLTLWLFGIFILRNLYEGSMFKFFYERPLKNLPENVDAALAGGYNFIIHSSFKRYLGPELLSNPGRLILFEESWSYLFEKLEEYPSEKIALIIQMDLVRFSNRMQARKRSMILSKFPVSHVSYCGYLAKYSFLNGEVNHHIRRMITNGEMERFYRVYVDSYGSEFEKPVSLLAMGQLQGVFKVLLLLFGVSIVVFIMECVSERFKVLGKIVDFLQ